MGLKAYDPEQISIPKPKRGLGIGNKIEFQILGSGLVLELQITRLGFGIDRFKDLGLGSKFWYSGFISEM